MPIAPPSGSGLRESAASSEPRTTNGDATVPPNPLPELTARAAELFEFARYYLEVRADSVRLTARQALIAAVLGVAALTLVLVFAVTCVVFLLRGAADGLTLVFGGRTWLGYLVLGVAGLAVLGVTALIVLARLRAVHRRNGVDKYEQRKRRQRARFGRDVEQAAHGTDGARVPQSAGTGSAGGASQRV